MKLYDSFSKCEYVVIHIYENVLHERYIFYSNDNEVYVSELLSDGRLAPIKEDRWNEVKKAFYDYRHSPEEGCRYCVCGEGECDCFTCHHQPYH